MNEERMKTMTANLNFYDNYHQMYLECKKVFGDNAIFATDIAEKITDKEELRFVLYVMNYFMQEWQKGYISSEAETC